MSVPQKKLQRKGCLKIDFFLENQSMLKIEHLGTLLGEAPSFNVKGNKVWNRQHIFFELGLPDS